MQFILIVTLSVLAAVIYGIVHDLVTAHLCVEYFTIGHPPVFGTNDPTLLALGWGVIATWWVGLGLGIPLALAARIERWPKRAARSLVRPIALLLAVMACGTLLAGGIGYLAAINNKVWLLAPLANDVPKDRHPLFIADLWAHLTSYGAGIIGGTLLVVSTFYHRIVAGRHRGGNLKP